MKNDNYNEETEKTIQLLDKLNKVKSSDYFATELEVRIEKLEEQKTFPIGWKLTMKYALFIMIIALNVVVSYSYLNGNTNSTTSSRQSLIEVLSSMYFSNSESTNNTNIQ